MSTNPPYLPHKLNPRRLSPFDLFQPQPSAFGENITYIEYLTGVLNTINQCIAYIKYMDERYQGWDEEIKDLYNQLSELSNRLTDEVTALKAAIAAGDAKSLAMSKTYTDQQVIILNDKINQIVSKLNPVYDPTTGLVLPVQVVIMNVYEAGRCDAITAAEYDALELSATAYDSKGLTAKQYDQHAKTLLIN